jgi:hypothetical protein
VVAGLQLVIPLMTPALLQFPKLGRRYFALLAVLMDVYPSQVPAYINTRSHIRTVSVAADSG